MSTPYRKNMRIDISIDSFSRRGEGVSRDGAFQLFVPGAIPGDDVRVHILKVQNHTVFAKLMEIVTPSPYRIASQCPIEATCGGCQFQSLDYEAQGRHKMELISEVLAPIQPPKINDILPMDDPYQYRNRSQYAISKTNNGLKIGLYKPRSHQVTNIQSCAIQHSTSNDILDLCRTTLAPYIDSVYNEDDHSGLLRHLVIRTSFSRNESMVILVINGDRLPFHDKWVSSLRAHPNVSSLYLCHNQTPGDEVLNGPVQHLWGATHLEETILERNYRVGPTAFFQSNPQQTEQLVSLIRNSLTSSPKNSDQKQPRILWDLYCGGGLFGIALSEQFDEVIGVDSSSENINDATYNASSNGIGNIRFICDDVIGFMERSQKKYRQQPPYPTNNDTSQKVSKSSYPTTVIIDPPRSGCDSAFLDSLCTVRPETVIYVSCNVHTLCRDLQRFLKENYRIVMIQPIDMFPHTLHTELLVILRSN